MTHGTFRSRGPDPPARTSGFTLIEALIAVALIGVGITALVLGAQSSTRVSAVGRDITQAALLAQHIREWTLKLPFSDRDPGDQTNPPGPDDRSPQDFVDDLDDLMDVTYSPPRDASGLAIQGADGWSQHITLEWKDPNSLSATVPPGSSDVVRAKVTVARDGRDVLTIGWLVMRRISE